MSVCVCAAAAAVPPEKQKTRSDAIFSWSSRSCRPNSCPPESGFKRNSTVRTQEKKADKNTQNF